MYPATDLPSTRRGTATAKYKTHLPGSKIAFNKFIYVLCALLFAFIAFDCWRLMQFKAAVGGWSNLALGRTGSEGAAAHSRTTKTTSKISERESVEDHITALAKALGLPSHDLASAVAQAVRHHIPSASLSSVSAAEATKSGAVVNAPLDVDKGEEAIGAGIAEN